MPPNRTECRKAKQMARINAVFGLEPDSGPGISGPEIDFFFAEDSKQNSPSRPGMGPLVAIGGINVAGEQVGVLGNAIDEICTSAGFPQGEEFKWSPGRELWMHSGLVGADRERFFVAVLGRLADSDVRSLVVIGDSNHRTATDSDDPETDVTTMFLERVESQCRSDHSEGFVVVDRPSGGRRDEDMFLAGCLETIQSGTTYIKPRQIAHNVVSTPSKLSRLLQAADFITGCTLAIVSGEQEYSPSVFASVLPLFQRHMNRIGGCGLKIHPDFRYANLYHWIVGDSHLWKGKTGTKLPMIDYPYCQGSFIE